MTSEANPSLDKPDHFFRTTVNLLAGIFIVLAGFYVSTWIFNQLPVQYRQSDSYNTIFTYGLVTGLLPAATMALFWAFEKRKQRLADTERERIVGSFATRLNRAADKPASFSGSDTEFATNETKPDQNLTSRELTLISWSEKTTKRLSSHTRTLERRAAWNLCIGIVVAFVGIASLAFTLATGLPETATVESALIHYIPRVSLALIIQFIAIFFLKLHRDTLAEIRICHNELTGAESRNLGLITSILSPDSEATDDIALQLLKVERNKPIQNHQNQPRGSENGSRKATIAAIGDILSAAKKHL